MPRICTQALGYGGAFKRKPDLRTLLGDPKAMLMLKNYIEATHRFGPQANQSR